MFINFHRTFKFVIIQGYFCMYSSFKFVLYVLFQMISRSSKYGSISEFANIFLYFKEGKFLDLYIALIRLAIFFLISSICSRKLSL